MPAKDVRSRYLTVRFTPSEFKRLERDAKAAGETVTEFLRQCWRGKAK
jgi:hypothetical protein